MDVSTELIMQGKVAAERAVKADNEGNHAQALRLYRLTVKLLHEGCELEQDPDAIVTLRGKVASFKRRIADLEVCACRLLSLLSLLSSPFSALEHST
jgi:hypothetical protein